MMSCLLEDALLELAAGVILLTAWLVARSISTVVAATKAPDKLRWKWAIFATVITMQLLAVGGVIYLLDWRYEVIVSNLVCLIPIWLYTRRRSKPTAVTN